MSIETEIAALTAATTALTQAVSVQQANVDAAVAAIVLTKERVEELANVENTSDQDKPLSIANSLALDEKQETLVSGSNISTVNGVSLLGGGPLVIARGAVEIPILNYNNRDTLRHPVLPLPLTGDVLNMEHLGQLQYTTTFDYVDDDEMVIEAVDPADGVTPIGQWVLTIPAFEWTQAQKMFENAVLWEWMEDELLFHTN
jgi:hypothetical protein